MFSIRFQLTVVISSHAKIRMVERDVSEAMLLEVIDFGEARYKDATHLLAFKEFPERHDNLLCAVLVLEDHVVVKTVMHHFEVLQGVNMHTTYFDEDDILVIRLSDKPITREISQNWNTHISYAEDGSAVEVVLLEARANGAYPLEIQHARIA